LTDEEGSTNMLRWWWWRGLGLGDLGHDRDNLHSCIHVN
jgi:hypothetical protein